MAYSTSTLRTVYALEAQPKLENTLLATQLCGTTYVGQSESAQTVKVPAISYGTAGSYTRNATSAQFNYPLESDSDVEITVNRNKQTNWSREYIDSEQMYMSYLSLAVDQRLYIVRDAIDKDIFEQMADGVAATNRINHTDGVALKDKNKFYDAVADVAVKLASFNAPKPWWIVVPPDIIRALRDDEKLPKHSSFGDNIAMTGAAGMVYGVNIFTSNNLHDDGTGGTAGTLIRCPAGWTGSSQLVMQVPLRIGEQDIQGYDRKGMFIISWYGFKVMYPNAMVLLTVDKVNAT